MIKVKISHGQLEQAGHETLIGMNVMKACKAAGIPIVGVFAMRGIERGTLTYTCGKTYYEITWSEDKKDEAAGGPWTQVELDAKVHPSCLVEVLVTDRHLASKTIVEDDDEL